MTVFVLDENVVIGATTRSNHLGEADLTCARLATGIIEPASPHQLAWSRSVYARWSRQVQILVDRRVAVDTSFIALFNIVMYDSTKCLLPDRGDPPALAGEEHWSTKLHDDRDFVRLAAYYPTSILSTSDEPLHADVIRLELDTRHGFRILFPGECLLEL